jgi:hypothetical protein
MAPTGFSMGPPGIKFRPRLPQILHGGSAHLSGKTPFMPRGMMAVLTVRRIHYDNSSHIYPLIQSVTRNRPPVIMSVRPFGCK